MRPHGRRCDLAAMVTKGKGKTAGFLMWLSTTSAVQPDAEMPFEPQRNVNLEDGEDVG